MSQAIVGDAWVGCCVAHDGFLLSLGHESNRMRVLLAQSLAIRFGKQIQPHGISVVFEVCQLDQCGAWRGLRCDQVISVGLALPPREHGSFN